MPMTGSESSRWRVKQLIRSNQQSETQGYSIYSERPQRKQQISGMFGRFTGFKLPFHYHNCLFEQYSHLRSWKHCFVLLFVIGSVLDVPLKAAVQPLLELEKEFKKKKKHNTKYLILVSVSQNKSNSFSVTRSANRNKSRDWETELFTDISFSWPEYSSVTRLLCGSALITLFAVNYKLEHRWGRRKWVQLKVK